MGTGEYIQRETQFYDKNVKNQRTENKKKIKNTQKITAYNIHIYI